MDYRLIGFDVDGTLVETKSGAAFRKSADDWQWLPGRLEKLQALLLQGISIVIATNQGGVAFGYFSFADIQAELLRMLQDVPLGYESLFMCVLHPKASLPNYRQESNRRKPGPGMLIEAMETFDELPDNMLYVGDRPEDEQAAISAGVAFMYANLFFGDEQDRAMRYLDESSRGEK